MRTFKLTLFALATLLTISAAHAEETDKMDVIVVTAARSDSLPTAEIIAIEKTPLVIDFTELKIEVPTLDRSDVKIVPARIELARQESRNPQS